MPKEYEKCKESYIKKGTPEKKAKAICAGMYYNRHGITVKEAEKRGLKSMLYVARTKSSLETILDSVEGNDYVIVPLTEEIRQKLKAYQPKVENEQYKYVALHKSLVDVSRDAKLVLRLEKLKENETSKQNEHNEPKVEQAQGVVKDGKVKSLTSEIMDEDVEVETKAKEKLPTLSEVMSKVARGEKLTAVERHILSVALDATKDSKSTTKEEREEAKRDLENEEISEKTKETLRKEFGSGEDKEEKEVEDVNEQKTLSATSSTAQAVEAEDMEPKKEEKEEEKEDEEKLKSWNSLLKSFGSLDPNVPIFNSKQEADRFARHYKLYYGQAVVRPAGLKEVRVYGSKAKYVVDVEQ
jgi:uncharacterized membrane protein